jgi:hypothetical protein
MKKLLIISLIIFSLTFVSSIAWNPPSTSPNSLLLQGLTPQQVANLYSETDPNYFSNTLGYYNSTTLPSQAETDPLWSSNYSAYNSSWSSTFNQTYHNYNSTGLIKDWNATGFIINWSSLLSGGNSSFNQSLTDSLYSAKSEPLWTSNQSLYYLKSNPFNFYNSTTLPASTENDTFQSVTTREANTTNLINFLNVTNFWDDVFIKPVTTTTYEPSCDGTPSVACSDYATQENCEQYSSYGGDCYWTDGSSCDDFDYDEDDFNCVTYGCTPSYSYSGSCDDFDSNEGDCSSNPPCYGDYTPDSNCDSWDYDTEANCEGNGMYTCYMDGDYNDCYNNVFTGCSGDGYNSYFSDCSGTYGETGCFGDLTCANQVASEAQCEYTSGCDYNPTGTPVSTIGGHGLTIEMGNANINGTINASQKIVTQGGICSGLSTCDDSTYKIQSKGAIYVNGSVCLNAKTTSQCSDTNWQIQMFGGSNSYGYIGAMKSQSTTRTQFQVATSDGVRGFVMGHYDGEGFMQIYSGSTAEQTLKLTGSTGQDTVTLKAKNLNLSGTLKVNSVIANSGQNITFKNSTNTGWANLNAKSFNVFSPEDKAYDGQKIEALPKTENILDKTGKLNRDYLFENEKSMATIDNTAKPIFEEQIIPCDANPSMSASTSNCKPIKRTVVVGYEQMPVNATDIGAVGFNNRLMIAELTEKVKSLEEDVETLKQDNKLLADVIKELTGKDVKLQEAVCQIKIFGWCLV